MTEDRRRQLAWMLVDPDQVDQIDPTDITELMAAMAGLQERLRCRLIAHSQAKSMPNPPAHPDRLLKPREAAEILNVNTKWMYAHADSLPFTRRLNDRMLRFSKAGLEEYMRGTGS